MVPWDRNMGEPPRCVARSKIRGGVRRHPLGGLSIPLEDRDIYCNYHFYIIYDAIHLINQSSHRVL